MPSTSLQAGREGGEEEGGRGEREGGEEEGGREGEKGREGRERGGKSEFMVPDSLRVQSGLTACVGELEEQLAQWPQ